MTMDWDKLLPILIALASGTITPIVIHFLQRKSKEKTESEIDLDISDAAQKIANGSASAVEVLEKLLMRYDKKIQDQDKKIQDQEREISNLNARITAMRIDEEARDRLDRERNIAIVNKFEALQDYIKVLVDTLRNNDIKIPPRPQLLKERDTLDDIKAIKFPIKTGETK